MGHSLDKVDITIVGAGVIGLAIARAISSKRSKSNTRHHLLILEKNDTFGEEISARNSEVIHAGIYYPQDSLKAQFCVRGKSLLYAYCQQHNIEHRAIGKLIVASHQDELNLLDEIKINATNNGVTDISFLSAENILEIEPNLQAVGALFSPSTGIINSHQLMLQFLAEIESKDGLFVPQTSVTSVSQHAEGLLINSENKSGEHYQFLTSLLINAAGLGAQALSKNIEGLSPHHTPILHYCKGSYFHLSGKSPFHHLIYPVPDKTGTGLGIHATIDLGGQVKFGPNTEYCDQLHYEAEESSRPQFEKAIKRYFPSLNTTKLNPAFAGMRPKLQGPGEEFKDFVIQTEAEHGVPGLIQLFGIESPGLTSCLAIGEEVARLI